MNPAVGSPPTTVLPLSKRYYHGAVVPHKERYYRPTILPKASAVSTTIEYRSFTVVGAVLAYGTTMVQYYRPTVPPKG